MVDSDPELRAEYERLGPRFMVIGEIIKARKRLGLTQRQLAERMGVSQPVVARLLSGNQSPRIDTVATAAAALNCDLVIELRPREASKPSSRHTGARGDYATSRARVAEDSPRYEPRPPRGGGRRR
jgi:transcriptional regulator with XRE-family HTH domain